MPLYPPHSKRFLHHCLQSLRFSAWGQMMELYLYFSGFHPLFCSVLIDWKIYNTAAVSPIQNQLHCCCGNKHNTTGTKKWQTQHEKSDNCAQLSHMLLSNKKKTAKFPFLADTSTAHYTQTHKPTLLFMFSEKSESNFCFWLCTGGLDICCKKKYGLLLQPGSLHLPLFSL